MSKYHHRPVKRFGFGGTIHDDSSFSRLREEYRKLLILEMNIAGYVPRLDIQEDFTVEYDNEKDLFTFELSVYGVYVGKKKSEWIEGIDGGNPVYTPKSKLSEYSQDQASQ